jgi:hypothetical protein
VPIPGVDTVFGRTARRIDRSSFGGAESMEVFLMADSARCPECGSSEVIPDVPVSTLRGPTGQVMVVVAEHPEAVLFKGRHLGVLSARVCGQCGLVRLFAHNPQELWAAYRQRTDA